MTLSYLLRGGCLGTLLEDFAFLRLAKNPHREDQSFYFGSRFFERLLIFFILFLNLLKAPQDLSFFSPDFKRSPPNRQSCPDPSALE